MKDRHLVRLIIAALFLTVAGSVFAADNPETEIRKVIQEQQDAWNRGDLAGYMNGYWKSDKVVFVGGEVRRGWQNVFDYYKTKYSDRAKMGTLTFSDIEITPHGADAALVLGSWKVDVGSNNVHGKTTLIFCHFPEGWRIVHDHSSAATN